MTLSDPFADSPPLLIAHADRIVTVTINRPAKRNALNAVLWQALAAAFTDLAVRDDVGAIILTGAGGTFSAGGDIAEFSSLRATAADARAYADMMAATLDALDRCPHPMVAAIEGDCIGGGVELALLCDLRIAGEGARFGIPINRLGFVMSHRELEALIRAVGRPVALEMLLEARLFGAGEAAAKGLLTRVVATGTAEAEAQTAALRIADGAPLVNRWHKAFARRLADPAPLDPAETETAFDCFATEDYRIGTSAFVAKSRPRFAGR